MISPLAAYMPTLRAADRPRFGWWITWMKGNLAAYLSLISPVLSVEPSSTTITSKLGYSTFWKLARQPSMVESAL